MSILDQYVEGILMPTKQDVKFLKSRMKKIRNVLTNNSNPSPREVVPGGSLSRGTMLKYKPDGDLICVYNNEKDISKNWQRLTDCVYSSLRNNFPTIEIEPAGNLAIHFITAYTTSEGNKREANIDVVPCYFINSPKMMKEQYNSKLYRANTTIWHTRYLQYYRDLPYNLNVVRLLKDWKNEQDVPLKGIHLELIVADVYDCEIEKMKNIDDILMLCFQYILDTMEGYSVVPRDWKYCQYKGYKEQCNRPVLIDPANPEDNLLEDLIDSEIKKIIRKVNITVENLKQKKYNDIFNRNNRTNFFENWRYN